MTALELEEITPDASIADLEKRWGISRNALKARAKALGIDLIRQGPTFTVWPGDRVSDGDRLDAHCKAGGALATFPGAVAVTPHASSDTTHLAVTPQGVSDSSQLAVLAAALAGAMPQPPVDPLQRARGLAEAADAGLVLTSADLANLLGQGVNQWRDGHQSYGYAFQRHQQGRQVLWTVTRAITASTAAPSLTAAPTPEPKRTPGFVACFDTPAIEAQVLARVTLPNW